MFAIFALRDQFGGRPHRALHFEHKQWLSQLAEMKIEVITLAKLNKNGFIKEIGVLLKNIISLKKIISKHEERIALAFKACGIEDYDEIFEDHNNIREEIESLQLNLDNLKILVPKYNKKRLDDAYFGA